MCALHEVSNALTVVLGWLDLARSAPTEEERLHAIEVAREHARRGQLLARQGVGAEETRRSVPRTAHALLEFVSLSLRPFAAEKLVQVELELQDGTDAALVAEAELVQILMNLLLNALQFSPTGSKVSVGVQRQEEQLLFFVQDEGPGVPPSRRAQLFSGGASTREGGAGIGLSHSAQLAERNGGRLAYQPTEYGARFELSWPWTHTTALRPSVRAEGAQALRGCHLLLIEDDRAVASLVELSCEARGAQVTTVYEAGDLMRFLATRPELSAVLLDLSPLQDCLLQSLDALAQLSPAPPLVLLSGRPTGAPPGTEGRFAAWVRKPFDMEQLTEVLARIQETSSVRASG